MRKEIRKLIVTFSVALLCIVCANQGYAAGIPKNGVQREYYANGKLQLETRYKNGLIVRRRTFYKSGSILIDYRYKDGEPYYKAVYYDNGKLRSLWTKKSGLLKNFTRDGRLKAVVKSEHKPIELY